VQVAPGRRQDKHAVPVDKFGIDADRVTEARLAAQVFLGQVVDRIDLLGVAIPMVIPKLRSRAVRQPDV
jgi:hypothetical protein